jgi:hypothetical protein
VLFVLVACRRLAPGREWRCTGSGFFIAFLAYCLHVTLGRRLHAVAPGLTPRRAIEKFAAVQMIDLHVPTTDGRELRLTRYTEPEPERALLLDKLKFVPPAQPKPKISAEPSPPYTPLQCRPLPVGSSKNKHLERLDPANRRSQANGFHLSVRRRRPAVVM